MHYDGNFNESTISQKTANRILKEIDCCIEDFEKIANISDEIFNFCENDDIKNWCDAIFKTALDRKDECKKTQKMFSHEFYDDPRRLK